MELRLTIVFFCVLLSLSFLASAESVEGTVSANNLNVRVKPGDKSAVIAQLKKDDKVVIVDFEKGWYEVAAPESSSVWISSAFVKDGVVQKKASLRTGPSVACAAYPLFATQGQQLKILDSTHDGWLRVAVFEGLIGWVSADFVSVPPKDIEKLVPADKEATPPKDQDKGKNEKTGKDDLSPAASVFQTPETVLFEGILLSVDSGNTQVTHLLSAKICGENFPLCFISSKKMNLKLWDGQKIQVAGRESWLSNYSRPIIEVDSINPLW